jgi:DNA polymerase III alpha subunit
MFDVIQEAGGYLFNLSHAVGYSALSYLTAWLKTYYSKEFLVALIEFPKPQKKEKAQTINRAVRELRNLGHKVKTPDINESGDKITIGSDGVVYMGLSDIAGVGTKAVEEIIQQRPYSSFDDFVGKVQKRRVNIRVLRNLVQAGVFDSYERRDKLYYSLVNEPFEEWDDEEMHKRELTVLDMPTETPLIEYAQNPYEKKVHMTSLVDIDFDEREEEIFVKGVISDVTIHKTSKVQLKEYYGDVQDMAVFDLDDGTYKVSCSVSPQALRSYSKEINDGESVFIKGHTFGMGEKLHVDGIISLSNPNDKKTPFKKYVEKNKREEEARKIYMDGYNVNVVSQVVYLTSKKGKDYARVMFTNGETWLCFQLSKDLIKTGEILIWSSNKKPFLNLHRKV